MNMPVALVIEDDPVLASIFAKALQEAEYAVIEVHDGQQALDYLSVSAPNIVVLDLHLPKVTGRELLTYIRNNENLTSTHVVLLSADAALSDYLESQADMVLIKPVGFNQLRELTARLNPLKRKI
jgi:DNA-binding response OmpR family regulator